MNQKRRAPAQEGPKVPHHGDVCAAGLAPIRIRLPAPADGTGDAQPRTIGQAVADVPVGLFCFELLYADGRDLTMAPYPERRAALEALFAQAVTDGCEGLVCESIGPDSAYQAGARGWQWIKLKRDYRSELADTADLAGPRAADPRCPHQKPRTGRSALPLARNARQ